MLEADQNREVVYLKINELARLAGASVRTLQHYDRIGLLKADKDPANGYRRYTAEHIDRLQEILLFRAMGMELREIGETLDVPQYRRLEALKQHRLNTLERRRQLDELVETIDASIREMEKGITMKQADKFKGMDFRSNPYEAEARENWGSSRVDEANATIAKKTDEELGDMTARMNDIFQGFAGLRGTDPTSAEAVRLSERFYQLLNNEIGSFYNKEVFKGLGQMYIDDERFTENLDRWGEGTARFMRDAMAHYSDEYL